MLNSVGNYSQYYDSDRIWSWSVKNFPHDIVEARGKYFGAYEAGKMTFSQKEMMKGGARGI